MWKYVICGRNIALGIYNSQEDAIASLEMSGTGIRATRGQHGDSFLEYRLTTRQGGSPCEEVFTIQTVRQSTAYGPLF